MITTATWTATYTTDGQTRTETAYGADQAKIRAELVRFRAADPNTITLTRGADERTGPGWSRAGTHASHGHGTCDNCGARGRAHARTDSSGITGRVCGLCSDQPAAQLSFS